MCDLVSGPRCCILLPQGVFKRHIAINEVAHCSLLIAHCFSSSTVVKLTISLFIMSVKISKNWKKNEFFSIHVTFQTRGLQFFEKIHVRCDAVILISHNYNNKKTPVYE